MATPDDRSMTVRPPMRPRADPEARRRGSDAPTDPLQDLPRGAVLPPVDTVALAALLLPLWLGPIGPPGPPAAAARDASTGPAASAAELRRESASPDGLQDPVVLRPGRSGTFVVANPGRGRLRARLVTASWRQTPTTDHLERTDDLQLTDSVLDLAPGETRTVGVRSARPVSAVERAYQILVEEPGDGTARAPRRIPVFVEPPQPRSAPQIADVGLFYRTASFVLRNRGSAHVRAERVAVVGLSASGAPLFTRELAAGVVLAGAARLHATDLPEESCRAATVEVQVDTDQGRIVATLGSPSCS